MISEITLDSRNIPFNLSEDVFLCHPIAPGPGDHLAALAASHGVPVETLATLPHLHELTVQLDPRFFVGLNVLTDVMHLDIDHGLILLRDSILANRPITVIVLVSHPTFGVIIDTLYRRMLRHLPRYPIHPPSKQTEKKPLKYPELTNFDDGLVSFPDLFRFWPEERVTGVLKHILPLDKILE
jgi:hypothetical protein